MAILALMTALFIDYLRKSRGYEAAVLSRAMKPSMRNYRVAIVVPVFNEPPRLVAETAIASKISLGGLGDVYVLDDSTDPQIRERLDQFSKEYGFYLIRRDNRKGYKAGAVNNWLLRYGDIYDLVMILDADQRPIPGIFEHVLQFFDDPGVAFVQVPQYYSELSTTIGLSSHIQQIPFFRVVLRGRQIRWTAFSLGSGTIFRIKHLKEVGGLYEETVTEDIYTSVLLQSKGLRSVYVDMPFIWHGAPPKDLPSYISQQNRWALGGFQLFSRLMSSRLSPSRLLDYLNGLYYWLHIGLNGDT